MPGHMSGDVHENHEPRFIDLATTAGQGGGTLATPNPVLRDHPLKELHDDLGNPCCL